VSFTGLSASLDALREAFPGIGESAVIVVTGRDQTDEAVAAVVGDSVYAKRYEKETLISIWPPRAGQELSTRLTFNDALGAAIPRASVEIFVQGPSSEDPRVCVRTATADDRGQLEIPHTEGALRFFSFIVSDPNYGVCLVDRYLHEQTNIVTPLVPRGTLAYERSIHGTILDPDGNPVRGAVIQCTNVRTLGEGLVNALHGWTYKSLSDRQGAFSLYLPNENPRNERGYLIPPKSQYQVRIEAPPELGLLPHV